MHVFIYQLLIEYWMDQFLNNRFKTSKLSVALHSKAVGIIYDINNQQLG